MASQGHGRSVSESLGPEELGKNYRVQGEFVPGMGVNLENQIDPSITYRLDRFICVTGSSLIQRGIPVLVLTW